VPSPALDPDASDFGGPLHSPRCKHCCRSLAFCSKQASVDWRHRRLAWTKGSSPGSCRRNACFAGPSRSLRMAFRENEAFNYGYRATANRGVGSSSPPLATFLTKVEPASTPPRGLGLRRRWASVHSRCRSLRPVLLCVADVVAELASLASPAPPSGGIARGGRVAAYPAERKRQSERRSTTWWTLRWAVFHAGAASPPAY
jgi:hypothetical protein